MFRLSLLFLALSSGALAAPKQHRPPATKAVDWSRVTTETAAGFVMGNPNARVKLVEYGSLTCPHCGRFDAEGVPPLVADYVRGGRVSWEFRPYLLNGIDIPATLAARCAGTRGFFPMLRALYTAQADWVGKVRAIPEDRMTAIQGMPPERQFVAIGQAGGFPAIGAAHGVPAAKIGACLANTATAEKLAAATGDASSRLKVNYTPAFLVNGALIDYSAGPTVWAVIRSKLDAALKS